MGDTANTISVSEASGNTTDAFDGNASCAGNRWNNNAFKTVNPSCIH